VALNACVQPSSKKTVIVYLNVAGNSTINTAGIRGGQKPLMWDNDLELQVVKKDTLYSAIFSLVTGYKFIEAKFTINGQFELNDYPNRKIIFEDGDTTVFNAKYNQMN
jgi:hypothetical protein